MGGGAVSPGEGEDGFHFGFRVRGDQGRVLLLAWPYKADIELLLGRGCCPDGRRKNGKEGTFMMVVTGLSRYKKPASSSGSHLGLLPTKSVSCLVNH